MKRRDFARLSMALTAGVGNLTVGSRELNRAHLQKPNLPRPGAKWGLISPGSSAPKDKIELAMSNVRSLGFEPVLGVNASKKYGFLAGTDEERLYDLHAMFANPEIEGIWCIRGGYGCTRLLPHIKYEMIAQNPKFFMGYSDVTALHHAFLKHAGLITFHGPIAAAELSEFTRLNLIRTWSEDSTHLTQCRDNENLGITRPEFRLERLIGGIVEGELIGGNLSILAAMAGTPYAASYRNKIVFIEDIGEAPYRLDRMLVQLLQASDFGEAAGYILGVFNDCMPSKGSQSLSLHDTIGSQFYALQKPMLMGFPIGHIKNQVTLPQGLQVQFNAEDASLTFLESAYGT